MLKCGMYGRIQATWRGEVHAWHSGKGSCHLADARGPCQSLPCGQLMHSSLLLWPAAILSFSLQLGNKPHVQDTL